jgi:hypothetical protein
VTARVGQLTQVGAAEQWLEDGIVEPVRYRNREQRQHGSVDPAKAQADHCDRAADQHRRTERARTSQPVGGQPVDAERRDDRRVHDVVKPACPSLAREEDAQPGDHDRAADHDRDRPRPSRSAQQRPSKRPRGSNSTGFSTTNLWRTSQLPTPRSGAYVRQPPTVNN